MTGSTTTTCRRPAWAALPPQVRDLRFVFFFVNRGPGVDAEEHASPLRSRRRRARGQAEGLSTVKGATNPIGVKVKSARRTTATPQHLRPSVQVLSQVSLASDSPILCHCVFPRW